MKMLAVLVLAVTAWGQVGPFGVPVGTKGKIELRGKTFNPELPALGTELVSSNQDVFYDACVFRPRGMAGFKVVGGRARLKGCLIGSGLGSSLLFSVESRGSLAFEECVFRGLHSFSTDNVSGAKKDSTITFDRCRFEPSQPIMPEIQLPPDSVSVTGAGVSLRSCDLLGGCELVSAGVNPMIAALLGKKVPDKVIVDAAGCWWGTAEPEAIKKRIKDRASGYTPMLNQEPNNGLVVFKPMAKAPCTEKLKPPEEKK